MLMTCCISPLREVYLCAFLQEIFFREMFIFNLSIKSGENLYPSCDLGGFRFNPVTIAVS